VADRQPEITSGSPDFAVLVVGASAAAVRRLQSAAREAGLADMRPPYGYVIRALAAEELTLTGLAERLGISKQAAAKLVDEMEAGGYVRRAGDRLDRRRKRLLLAERGQEMLARALAASGQMEAELREELGDEAVDTARSVLLHFIARHGDLDHARARRVRPAW
jgi:DNA-binding MarR family transcriptional regulator